MTVRAAIGVSGQDNPQTQFDLKNGNHIFHVQMEEHRSLVGGRKFLERSRQVPEGEKREKNNNSKAKVK